MNSERARPWLQFHLLSILLVMLSFGVLLHLNLTPRVVGDPKSVTHYSYSAVVGEHIAYYGFPYVACESGIGTQGVPPTARPFRSWFPSRIFINILVALVSLIFIFAASEFAIRRMRRKSSSS